MFIAFILVVGLLVSLGVYSAGYHAGKHHRGWLERQAQQAEAAATEAALRLKFERALARDQELRPLWDDFARQRDDARQAFEEACASPAFMVRMSVDNDYPNFHVFKRQTRSAYVGNGDYIRDAEGRNCHVYTEAPPVGHEFTIHYIRLAPNLSFPTAPDAERWLTAALNPEDTAWGYTPSGRATGTVARALLPSGDA